jgi:hypothetical protein
MARKKGQVSAPAYHAATVLLENFKFTLKPTSRIPAGSDQQQSIAVVVDVCTDVFRCEEAMDSLLSIGRKELSSDLNQLRAAIRAVETVNNHLPRFEHSMIDPVLIRDCDRATLQKQEAARLEELQQREQSHLSQALQEAKTVSQEQDIVRQAGLLR